MQLGSEKHSFCVLLQWPKMNIFNYSYFSRRNSMADKEKSDEKVVYCRKNITQIISALASNLRLTLNIFFATFNILFA